MSSEYKIKGRQRSKPATPYERKTGLVNRVKDWLSLPSWLKNWNSTGDDENSGSGNNSSSSILHGGAVPSTAPVVHQQASFAQSTTTRTTPLFPLQVTLPSLLQNNTTLPLTSTTGEPGPSRRLFQMTSSQGSTETIDAMEQGGLDSSQDSEGSWVAEDDTTGNVQSQESGESSTSTLSRPMQLSTPLSRLPISGSLEYEIGEGKLGIAPESTVVVSTSSSLVHTVERIANPALLNAKSLPVRTSNFSNRKVTSSSNLDQRLHSAYPLITSTPQLSPVHEERSQNVHVDERPDPNLTQLQSQVSVSNSSDRQSFNKSHSKTPMPGSISTLSSIIRTPSSSKHYTEESIKRSPFHSPFYSGRTSFGGAASQQSMRIKRPRTESSPPTLAPLRVSVTARPMSSDSRRGQHQLVASKTAKRILTTLEGLNSPLTDARKLPMKTLPGEYQKSKRRRMSDIPSSGATMLSPPPVTPLRTPSSSFHRPKTDQQTQIVPNEKTRVTNKSPLKELMTLQKQQQGTSKASPLPSSQPPSTSSQSSLSFTVPQFNTMEPPIPSSILAGIKFTPAPPSQPAGVKDSSEKSPATQVQRDRTPPPKTSAAASSAFGFKPSFHGGTSAGVGGGGKMRSKRGHLHFSRESEEVEEIVVNPLAPPPAVGLALGKGGSLPQFKFHAQLTKSKAPSLVMPTSTSSATLSSTPSTAGYSFSLPKAIDSGPITTLDTHQQKTTFDFRAPTTCAPLSSASTTLSSTLASTNKTLSSLYPTAIKSQSALPPLARRAAPAKQPPPLKNMSVEEALKKPEFQLPKMKPIPQMKAPSQPSECIDLTDSDDKDERTQQKPSVSNGTRSLPPFGGGLQLGSGLKVGNGLQLPSSGIQLGSKNSFLTPAPPLKPLAQFAPPSSSWTCDTCMVPNKAEDVKCVACSASKPGSSKPASASSALSAVPSLGSAGGIKLGEPLSILKSNQSLKPATQTFQPLTKFAPPSGSWTCDTCMLSNKAEDSKCIACTTPKPGSTKTTTSAANSLSAPSIGTSGGLKIGGSLFGSKPVPESKSSSAPKFQPLSKFAPPSGSWTCDTCMVSNKAEDSKCVACTTPKPDSAKPSATAAIGSSGGLKLGSSSLAGLKPQEDKTKTQTNDLLSKFAPPSGSWTCDTCMVQNKAEDVKCAACSALKPGAKSQPQTQSTAKTEPAKPVFKPLTQFAPPSGSWTCDTCMISNKPEATSCAACSTPKPGVTKTDSKPDQTSKPSGELAPGGGLKLGGGLSLGGPFKLGGGVSLGGSSLAVKPPEGQAPGGGLLLGGGLKLGAGSVSLGGASESGTRSVSGGLKLGSLASAKDDDTKTSTDSTAAQTKPISFSVQQPVSKSSGFSLSTTSSTLPAQTIPQLLLSSATTQLTQTTSSSLQFNLGASSTTQTGGIALGSITTTTATALTSSSGVSGGLQLGTLSSSNSQSASMKNPLAGIKLTMGGMTQSSSVPSLGAPSTNKSLLAGIKLGGLSQQPPVMGAPQLSLGGQVATGLVSSSSANLASQTSNSNLLTGAMATTNTTTQGFQFSARPSFGITTTSSQMSTGSNVPTFNFTVGKLGGGDNKTGSSLFVFGAAKDSSSGSPFTTASSASALGAFGSGMGGSEQPKLNVGGITQQKTSSVFGSAAGQSNMFGGVSQESSQQQGLNLGQQQPNTNLEPKNTMFGTPNVFGNQTQSQQQQQQQQSSGMAFNFHAAGSGGSGAPMFNSGSGGSVFGTEQAALKMPLNTSGGFPFQQTKLDAPGLGGASRLQFGAAQSQQPTMFNANQSTTETGPSAGTGAGSSSGFVFNTSAGPNFNFSGGSNAMESGNGSVAATVFTASSQGGGQSGGRVIKKARRRNAK